MYSHNRFLVLVGSSLVLLAAGCMPGGPDPAPSQPPPTAGTGGSAALPPGGMNAAGAGGSGGSATPGDSGGSGGSGGSSAGSGGSSQPDTAPSNPDPDPIPTDASAPDTTPSTPPPGGDQTFNCTRYIGINATAEWFNQGFEALVGNDKWELVRVHSGFVDLWANPGSAFWNTNPTSACAAGAKPDRVIFVGLRFEWTSTEQWTTALTGVVKNIKDKFPGVKSIELATFVRAPGNKPCPQRPAPRSTIHPSADEAIAKVVATDPVLLKASPRFEVTACSDFSGNPPHFTAAGGRKVAAIIAAHYNGAAK